MTTFDDDPVEMNTQADLGNELTEQMLLGSVRGPEGDRLLEVLDELRSLRSAPAPAMSDDLSAAFASYREQHKTKKAAVAAWGTGVGVAGFLKLAVGAAAATVAVLGVSTGVPFVGDDKPSVTISAPPIESTRPNVAGGSASADKPAEKDTDTAPARDTSSNGSSFVSNPGYTLPDQAKAPIDSTPRPTSPGNPPTSPPVDTPEPPVTPPVTPPPPTSSPNLLTTVTGTVTGTVGGVLDLLL